MTDTDETANATRTETHPKTPALVAFLAYAGAVPFIAFVVLSFYNPDAIEARSSGPTFATFWALAIVSFMAGTQWGIYLIRRDGFDGNLFISSNFIAVIGWFSIFWPQPVPLVVFALLFCWLLFEDWRLAKAGITDGIYLRTRVIVTAIVVVCLLAIAGTTL